MKKTTALILICACFIAFAACRHKDPAVTPDQTAVPTDTATHAIIVNVAKFAEIMQPEIKAASDSMGDTMDISCYADGMDLVVEYKFLNEVDPTEEELRASVEAESESFKGMFEELSGFVNSDKVRVVLRYLRKDGSVILNYVVDKDHEYHGEGFDAKYDSLEAFVSSEAFLSSIRAADVEGQIETTAIVENISDVVIVQKFLQEMDAGQRGEFKSSWEASMAENGDLAAKTLANSIKLAVDIDRVGIIYRVVDKDGDMIAEYRANVD